MSTSGWVAHASREPSGTLVTALRTWIDESVRMTSATPGTCPVLADPLYAAIVGHMDRALHKRRQRPTFLSAHACGLMPTMGHGLRPMSELLGTDEYGPEDLRVEHTQGASTLAEALARATSAERSALVPIFTEAEFMDSDMFHLHTSRLLDPRFSGVVIPFMIVPAGHSEEEGDYREDVVRAAGYTSYLFECDWDRLTADDHSRLAMLMEDVLDEIVQIKADAEAHVMSMPPLWPMVEIRSTAGAN